MMTGVLLEVLAQICPSTSNANHDSLTIFANETNVKFYGGVFTGLM